MQTLFQILKCVNWGLSYFKNIEIVNKKKIKRLLNMVWVFYILLTKTQKKFLHTRMTKERLL